MTRANFSTDTDAKWIIGLAVVALVVAFGYLLNVNTAHKPNDSPMTQQAQNQQPR